MNKPIELPKIRFKDKEYWIDWRLKEFRTVKPPLEIVPFNSLLGREIDAWFSLTSQRENLD